MADVIPAGNRVEDDDDIVVEPVELDDEQEEEGPHDGDRSLMTTEESQGGGEIVESVDEALDEVGGWGKHQRQVHLIQLFLMVLGSYAFYPMGYYELQP